MVDINSFIFDTPNSKLKGGIDKLYREVLSEYAALLSLDLLEQTELLNTKNDLIGSCNEAITEFEELGSTRDDTKKTDESIDVLVTNYTGNKLFEYIGIPVGDLAGKSGEEIAQLIRDKRDQLLKQSEEVQIKINARADDRNTTLGASDQNIKDVERLLETMMRN